MFQQEDPDFLDIFYSRAENCGDLQMTVDQRNDEILMKLAETVGGTEVVLGNVVTGEPLTVTTLAAIRWKEIRVFCRLG